ncbi:MAG: ATP-dependent DNA helicase [Candidatus Shapirobacteria bacterium]|nr:ATP-dependent DNA helicase [Candidatus Shapirobacteria bacterium]
MKESSEKKLNTQQVEAIKYGDGPLLIIAGAGTGKTTVITERIKYFVSSGKAKPAEILALTFTDKAAREMEERVDIAMPYGYLDMWIATFHSFCDRVLRQEAIHIGLSSNYKLMTEAEAIQLLTKNLFKFDLNYFRPLGNPTKFISGMLQHFSRLKDEDVLPAEYLKFAKKQVGNIKIIKEEKEKTSELAKAYQSYEEIKIKEGVMDFADLITNCLKLFRTRPNILAQYQKQFKYLLVDEFQDTNYAQNKLAVLMAGKKQNITVCADDDQAIYRWRGAAISNVIQFRKTFPKTKIVVLVQNYRSSQIILDQSYQLIKNNNPDRLEIKEKIDKHLKAVRKIEQKPAEFIHADRVENEAENVAKKIKELAAKDYKFSDIAILVRANNHAEPFIRALSRAGIPYQFLGPGQLFRQSEVKDLIAYLKVLYNFDDNVALYRVLSMEPLKIEPRDLVAINNFARRQNVSLFEACEIIDKIFVSDESKEKINNFIQMVHRHFGFLLKETAGQILYYFLQDSGLLKRITEYKTPLEEKAAQNISKFFDRLKTYEVNHEDASVSAVVDWINLSMDLGESPLANNFDWFEEDKVNLLTIHSAKGLEFPVVFLVNLVAARFPTNERKEQIPIPDDLIKEILPSGNYHEQEERRLFYVGMTRARDQLFLTAADYYGEGKREKKLSPFVLETLGKTQKELEGFLIASKNDQLSIFDFKPAEEMSVQANRQIQPLNYLSYSQIETFKTCPLQYRYRYLQRIPVSPSSAQSFGDTIHKTLKEFCQRIKDGGKLTEKDLLNILNINWSSSGYASKAHEEKSKERAKKMLKEFFIKFDPKTVLKDLEQTFMIKITPALKVGGKIDRLDLKGDKLEVIDYKTGKTMEQKDIDKSLQMTVYALAATDKGIYNQKPENLILTFYFLDSGEKKSTKRTKEQLEQAKKEIIEKAKEIQASLFEPKPGMLCDFCEYKLLCEAWN